MVNEDYDLELEKVASKIKSSKAKKVLIQLGEGLKPRSNEIQNYILEHNPECKVYFWLNSCYGKCDIPEILDSKHNDFDLLIQFGH
jgi:diphthamide biosynthesis enzyme Dph1/Dph2-like protein